LSTLLGSSSDHTFRAIITITMKPSKQTLRNKIALKLDFSSRFVAKRVNGTNKIRRLTTAQLLLRWQHNGAQVE